jgi:hypothetical protein
LTYKSTILILQLMNKSTPFLKPLLAQLTDAARQQGLSDSAWAAQSHVRKETLSRIRSRLNADFATVEALARTVGAHLEVRRGGALMPTGDGHFPARLNRDEEQRLLELAVTRSVNEQSWLAAGPRFFMAGFAVMLASLRGMDRRAMLELAEHLHPGSSHPDVFALWLARSPLRPSRFAPLLMERLQRAA